MPTVGEESTNHGEDFFTPLSSDKDARVRLTCWCGLKLDRDFFKVDVMQSMASALMLLPFISEIK